MTGHGGYSHEAEGHGTSGATGCDVFGEFDTVAVGLRLLEDRLDLVLEGEVERLSWEVTQTVRQVTTPERQNA